MPIIQILFYISRINHISSENETTLFRTSRFYFYLKCKPQLALTSISHGAVAVLKIAEESDILKVPKLAHLTRTSR